MKEFENADVVFVADYFLEDYGGGAERTTDALIETSPYSIIKVYSKDLSQEMIQLGIQKTWVFFNFRMMNHELIPLIVGNLKSFVVEYDYKFCQFRSLDLHLKETGKNCDCDESQLGKIITAFFHGSEHIFWMSQKQAALYHEKFPFLKHNNQTVLSSVFSIKDLEYIDSLNFNRKESNNKWAVIDGNSWIKGIDESIAAVKLQGDDVEAEVIGGLPYYNLLRKLSKFAGLSFHPLGDDTCPRTTIEAKLLGLELSLGEKVQHKDEEWFNKSREDVEDYLLSRHEVFWNTITSFVERDITVSGYTTTRNVIELDYPWKESIKSMLGFCDEVIVLDGGSTDGTWEELQAWSVKEDKLIVKQVKRDWDNYRFALYDFQQKAIARTLCTSDWCWQMDIDEIVHEKDFDKVKRLIKSLPKATRVACLPVIDFWGKENKLRIDVHPWKWRLSKNDPDITHDIPREHRRYDEKGNLYSAGSDGCDYVNFSTYDIIPSINFYTDKHEEVRQFLNNNREDAKYDEISSTYKKFIMSCMSELPSVYHYSWFDIERKINNYRDFWCKFHASLYNKNIEDSADNNKVFNKPWSTVTNKEIKETAKILNDEFGGWIFHKHLDLNSKTDWIQLDDNCHPKFIKQWIKERK